MRLLKLIPDHTNIDFVGVRYYAFAVDGLLVLITLISLLTFGLNLGIDFTGGVEMEVKAPQTIDVGVMRSKIDSLGFQEADLQYVSGAGACDTPINSCVLIHVKPQANDQAVSSKIQTALGPTYTIRRNDVVGPKVSGELLSAGVWATIAAVVMIAIYVAVRFEWQYGVGAIVATGHDVLVTTGLYSVLHTHFEFTLSSVAALLTLAGYSVNDTVVVFDRIRENRRRYKRMPLRELINLSTNQTLSRTVLTSGATAISITPLLLFGGPTLFNFTAAILFGIVVGTFSSVYVASALLLYLPQVAGRDETPPAAGAEKPPGRQKPAQGEARRATA